MKAPTWVFWVTLFNKGIHELMKEHRHRVSASKNVKKRFLLYILIYQVAFYWLRGLGKSNCLTRKLENILLRDPPNRLSKTSPKG